MKTQHKASVLSVQLIQQHTTTNMKSAVALILFGVVSLAMAQYGHYGHHEEEHYPDHHPEYKFEYSVHDPHTHDIKSQHESRHGDVVKGYYTLKEADGSTREVHYTADKHNGFNAIVTKDGHQIHPAVEQQGHQLY